uniref:SSD domain-containing protein n=1 Tax=Ditylenchus dipsaci TaxID=166011 RepID=A0A915CYN5_9BILA
MTQARDGGSLLREDYRWLLYNLTRALQTEVKVFSHQIKGANGQPKIYSFTDLCEPYCEMNTAFLAFLKLYDPNNSVTYTYPSIDLFGTKAFIGNNVYGIKLKARKSDQELKVLKSFTTAVMPFYLVADYEDTDVLVNWQHAAIKLFERPEYSTWLKTGMTGDNLVSYEVRRMGIETGPLIFGSIVAMILFVVSTSFRVKPAESKPWECLIGCLIPLLAMVAAMGAMSALGMRFQSIIVAAIFLVLSVGVDDIFMLTRAWHRSAQSLPIPERLATALEEAGPSITISSLTNVMSFAIGALSDTPAVRTFCIFSAVAITICYLYQLILLAAIVALSGKRENSGHRAVLCCFMKDPQAKNRIVEFGQRIQEIIVDQWAWAVTKWQTRVILLFVMIYYFYISWTGISKLQSNISIDKMALPNSYLHDFQHSFESALRNMQPISVFVLQPGDLRRPDQLQRVKNLVNDFERSLNAYGSESTFFWLTQYQDFLHFYIGENAPEEDPSFSNQNPTSPVPFSYTEIPTFFKSATYFYLSSFVHMNETACLVNQPECISSFFFITNFHNVIKYHELVPTVKDWRRLAEKYEDLKVYAYSDHTPFVDQTMSIDQTVFGSVAAALGCTALICLAFIPHLLSKMMFCLVDEQSLHQTVEFESLRMRDRLSTLLAYLPTLCYRSSFFCVQHKLGIFGILSLWDVDLDPLSMAALLMGIGFSVDFTAHISYHYYKAPKGSARKRMKWALGVIGWPMMQVGLSTIVALLPLLFKQSYLAMVFLKTIGLIILPAVLTMLTPPRKPSLPKKKEAAYLSDIKGLGKKTREISSADSGIGHDESHSSASTSETNSGHGSSSDSSSERSSQRSNQRKESFYKTQQLIKSINKELGWSDKSRRRSLFTGPNSLFSHDFLKKDAPISIADLANTQCTAPTALVHKIPLGRSNSNAL